MRFNILIADDEPVNLALLREVLSSSYNLFFAKSGTEALMRAAKCEPDLILLDIMMPEMSGFDVCRRLQNDHRLCHIPVILISALSDEESEQTGFDAGAVDYISKPFKSSLVKARVKTHLALHNQRKELEQQVKARTEALQQSQLAAIRMLGRAAEYKDNETGNHVLRMSHYAQTLALASGWSEPQAELLLNAALMHDIGKIGVPDSVLRKPGPLNDEEWEIMKTHPEIGAQIIQTQIDLVQECKLLRMAKKIALSHHEKWDGTGYPNGLIGERIPIEGRIVAIADVFDTLTSAKPYKQAWSVEAATAHIAEQSGKHFDPTLVETFLGITELLLPLKEKWAD